MRKLADEIHGTPVIDRAAEELAIIAKRQAKKAPIEGVYRTKAAQKADLEKLNCEYSELRRDITDTYLEKRDIKGEEVYWKLPDNLHAWRHIHSLLVLDAYPEHKPQVDAIERLLQAQRDQGAAGDSSERQIHRQVPPRARHARRVQRQP